MILCIDIGNTNIKYGVYDGDDMVASFRVSSSQTRTADEYGAILIDLIKTENIDKSDIDGVIIASVIPSLNYTISHMCEYFFKSKPLMVGPGIKTGLNIIGDSKEMGADRIVSSVAAFKKYGGPVIIVDFGTATTFNIIDESCTFIGGVISPGIKRSLDSLVSGTARLPHIELETPPSVLARTTVTNMQAGIIFGFAGLVESIIKRIKKEMKRSDVTVVATGGLGQVVIDELSCIDHYDRRLTLEGLKILYNLNTEKK